MKDKEKQNISMKEVLTKRSFEPITNCNCVEDKEKQIEEIAKVICNTCKTRVSEQQCNSDKRAVNGWCSMCEIIAEELVKHYQPKLPEDSVVLSREEYSIIDHKIKHLERVCSAHEKTIAYWEEETKIAREDLFEERKETVEKIMQDLKPLLEGFVHTDTGENLYVYKCKQFSVEIKE